VLAELMLCGRAATVRKVLVDECLQSDTSVVLDENARSLGQKISSATAHNTMARIAEGGYIS
jgi:hypothetical protein